MNVQRKKNDVPYNAGVESLMYAMMSTRVDLAFVVSIVSQFMLEAGPSHWMAVKRIMRYLKDNLDFKLCLMNKKISLRGFCNTDGVRDANHRRSVTKYVFLLVVRIMKINAKVDNKHKIKQNARASIKASASIKSDNIIKVRYYKK